MGSKVKVAVHPSVSTGSRSPKKLDDACAQCLGCWRVVRVESYRHRKIKTSFRFCLSDDMERERERRHCKCLATLRETCTSHLITNLVGRRMTSQCIMPHTIRVFWRRANGSPVAILYRHRSTCEEIIDIWCCMLPPSTYLMMIQWSHFFSSIRQSENH